MEKKIYVTPNIQILEFNTVAMLAVSGPGLSSDGTSGNLGSGATTGNAATAHTATRQYFDSWTEDEEDYDL